MASSHPIRNALVVKAGLDSHQPSRVAVMTCLPVVLFFVGASNYAFGAVINAVGFNGTILRSEDDGATWSLTTINAANWNRELLAVDFVDGDTGWVSGHFYNSGSSNHRTIMRYTTDGGVNWRVADFPGQNLVLDLHFIDSNTGWFVAGGGNVGRSDDGGLTWAPQILAKVRIYFPWIFWMPTKVGRSEVVESFTQAMVEWTGLFKHVAALF